jgi:hypothetical protein
MISSFAAKLDDQAAGNDDGEAEPGGRRHVLMQNKPAAQNAGQRKERHIDANEPGEIPLHRIDQQTVTCQRGATAENPKPAAAQSTAQSAAHDGVAGHFQTGRARKNQPGKNSHNAGALCAPILWEGNKNARQKR